MAVYIRAVQMVQALRRIWSYMQLYIYEYLYILYIYSCVSVHVMYMYRRIVSLLLLSSTPVGIPPNFPKDRCRRFSRFSRRRRRYNNNNMVKWYNTVK